MQLILSCRHRLLIENALTRAHGANIAQRHMCSPGALSHQVSTTIEYVKIKSRGYRFKSYRGATWASGRQGCWSEAFVVFVAALHVATTAAHEAPTSDFLRLASGQIEAPCASQQRLRRAASVALLQVGSL